MFALANAAIHGVIDWNIWRLYKLSVIKRFPGLKEGDEYKYWEDHWFYSTIGLDQLLHILTIITIFSFFI